MIWLYVLSYEPFTLSVSNERDRMTQIAGGGGGLVLILDHPRDRKYAEASTIMMILSIRCGSQPLILLHHLTCYSYELK
jgi:hypothetical protein